MKTQKQVPCAEEQNSKVVFKLPGTSKIESEKPVSECSTETFKWSGD
jgi:hypothetical protein